MRWKSKMETCLLWRVHEFEMLTIFLDSLWPVAKTALISLINFEKMDVDDHSRSIPFVKRLYAVYS